jgi:hypothetical protein
MLRGWDQRPVKPCKVKMDMSGCPQDAYIQALTIVKKLLDANGVGRLGQGGDNEEEGGGRVHIDLRCLVERRMVEELAE